MISSGTCSAHTTFGCSTQSKLLCLVHLVCASAPATSKHNVPLHCTGTGTHHNRKAFLAAAQRSLLPLNAAGQLAFGDVHSLLQLLCPDFPASVVKNAWSSAVDIQECECVSSVRSYLGRQ
jgi:hypothetical protein